MEYDARTWFINTAQTHIHCDGITELLNWLDTTTDFFTAPASTRFHGSHQGGLVQHSINVLIELSNICFGNTVLKYLHDETKVESMVKVALFHDVCKVNCYKDSYRNVKHYIDYPTEDYEEWQIKHDDLGYYVWKSEKIYIFEDDYPLGHGEKSLYLLNQFIPVTKNEAIAIRYHMGAFRTEDVKVLSQVFEKYPLALALHMADMIATNCMEDK